MTDQPILTKQKTIKVRRKVESEKPGPKTKVLKIAKKLSSNNCNFPIPDTIQEDLILEKTNTPALFLQASSSSNHFISRSPFIPMSARSAVTPTDIVGSRDQFYKRINLLSAQSTRTMNKPNIFHDRIRKNTVPKINVEEKLKKIREDMWNDKLQEENSTNILTPGGRITSLQQKKSLEAYERQLEYWKKIEVRICDKIKKNPEKLTLNSAREYEVKKQEIQVMDNVQKSNEVFGQTFWKDSLRLGLYSTEEELPRVQTAEHFRMFNASPSSPMKLNSVNTDKILRTTHKSKNRKCLRNNDYFQSKLKGYNLKDEDLMSFPTTELQIKGKNKLNMEVDAAKRLGIHYLQDMPKETSPEQVFIKKYDPRVLY
ncbi:hypothetical protein SteCoe_10735 [Stentor coeruleus]|uniref:Uncharacterized protein n=1 Tax=Stentor coeruleus TaxID=5963 RepID=A0A1R2CF33_9CILI|nr:hypothetical protein SteCoe_10735 [Stentor coeruleus]